LYFIKIKNEQKSRTPLKLERMAAIFEQTKDMGVLFGKGGLYGNVSDLFSFNNYCLKRRIKSQYLFFNSSPVIGSSDNFNSFMTHSKWNFLKGFEITINPSSGYK
jgi:hypothetical protein